MSQNENNTCPYCHSIFPITNKILHDLRCPGRNQSNFNNNLSNVPQSNFNVNNINNYRNNYNNNNNLNNNFNNNMNNIISSMMNSIRNFDGTITQIKTETFQNGHQRITNIKYDQNGRIISTQSYMRNLNENNDNENVQRTTDRYGNIIETREVRLPNGGIQITRITRDRNGNIINQSVNSSSGNGFNNIQNNNMNNFNMINMGMNVMNNMNNMMNMNMLMNNMNDMNNMNNGVAQNILDILQVSKLNDVSHLEEDKKQCSICLEEYRNGDEVVYLPCLHIFHKDCIYTWLRNHDDCPICKFKLTLENMNF